MKIDEKIGFGKYRDFTPKEIFCGAGSCSTDFMRSFISERFSKGETWWIEISTPSNIKSLVVLSFRFISYNEIEIDVELKLSVKDFQKKDLISTEDVLPHLNGMLRSSELSFEKFAFGSANDVLLLENKIKGTTFLPFADIGYIFWCIREVDNFYIEEAELEYLEDKEVIFFEGVHLEYKDSNKFYCNPIFRKTKVKISDEIKIINSEKVNSKRHNNKIFRPNYEEENYGGSYEKYGCYFGSSNGWNGPNFSDDIIDDAFEGDPENYWNID